MKQSQSDHYGLLLALALDLALGEPPNRLHPVAWLGSLIGAIERRAPRAQPRRELFYGAGMTAGAILNATLPALVLERWKNREQVASSRKRPGVPEVFVSALALKPAFAGRALFDAVAEVRRPLLAGDLATARLALRSLVSRDPSQLDAPLIAAAAIQSLAENASDSFVAPLLYYSLFGLPGAWAYRAVNTLDAMVGYHGRYEYLGKVAARLDDLLNLVPSRLTALLIVFAAGLARNDACQAWEAALRDHACTESPNAGYPMSAIAGALGICLEKVGHYRLNPTGRVPSAADIVRAERVVALALALAAVLAWAKRYTMNCFVSFLRSQSAKMKQN